MNLRVTNGVKRNRILSGIVLAAVVTLTAHADDASKRAKLHEMFLAAHIDQTLNLMFEAQQKQLPKLMQQMMPGVQMTPEQKADLDAFLLKVQNIFRQQAGWDKLEPQFTDIYASVYSEQEIDGLLAFYKSPVGVEMVSKQPELVEKSQAATQGLLVQVQPQIMQAAMEFAAQMKAKYGNSPAAAPAAAPAK